jgi:hypothetical protein
MKDIRQPRLQRYRILWQSKKSSYSSLFIHPYHANWHWKWRCVPCLNVATKAFCSELISADIQTRNGWCWTWQMSSNEKLQMVSSKPESNHRKYWWYLYLQTANSHVPFEQWFLPMLTSSLSPKVCYGALFFKSPWLHCLKSLVKALKKTLNIVQVNICNSKEPTNQKRNELRLAIATEKGLTLALLFTEESWGIVIFIIHYYGWETSLCWIGSH